MREADATAELQAQGCRGISMLAEKEGDRPQLLAKGAIDVVCAAMRAHPADGEVQAAGCSALGNLAIGDGEPAVRQAALELVLQAMGGAATDAAVQAKACRALGNCAFSPEGEAHVIESGGAEALLGAMRAHPDDAAVQEEACDGLLNLPAAKERVLAAKGLVLVAGARKRHPEMGSAAEVATWLTTTKA